jgi:hypothetical protein
LISQGLPKIFVFIIEGLINIMAGTVFHGASLGEAFLQGPVIDGTT